MLFVICILIQIVWFKLRIVDSNQSHGIELRGRVIEYFDWCTFGLFDKF